jgi:DNA-binding beta-propeller fold protein YncE
MTGLDELLTDALRDLAEAAPQLPPLSRRARRRIRAGRAGTILASAVAVAGTCTGLAVAAQVLGTRSQPAAQEHPLGRPMAYVLTDSGTVVPISLATNRPGRAIHAVHRGSYGGLANLAIAPDGRTVYVSSTGGPTTQAAATSAVTPVNVTSGRAGRPILVPSVTGFPGQIAITPNGKTAYVLDGPDGAGAVPIDLASWRALTPVPISDAPSPVFAGCFAITPDGATFYVLEPDLGTVVPVRTATNTALKPIKLVTQPYSLTGIAVTPDGKTAYVITGNPAGARGLVIPVDLATGAVQRPITLTGAPAATGIAIAPDGRTAYVVAGLKVIPVDLATGSELAPIELPARAQGSVIVIDPHGGTAYVPSVESDTVTPIDLATDAARKPIKTAGLPDFVAFAPDGKTAYIGSSHDTVTPVSTATGRAGRAISVGGEPAGIVFTP